jgi:hypothetical protein
MTKIDVSTVSDIQRITFEICGVVQGGAEGRFAIVALIVLAALVLATALRLSR